MRGFDNGLGLWYTCFILNKEMCIEYHITSSLSVGYDSSEYDCRSGLQQYVGLSQKRFKGIL